MRFLWNASIYSNLKCLLFDISHYHTLMGIQFKRVSNDFVIVAITRKQVWAIWRTIFRVYMNMSNFLVKIVTIISVVAWSSDLSKCKGSTHATIVIIRQHNWVVLIYKKKYFTKVSYILMIIVIISKQELILWRDMFKRIIMIKSFTLYDLSNLKSHVQAKYECIRVSCENCNYYVWRSKEHQLIKIRILV